MDIDVAKYSAYVGTGFSIATIAEGMQSALGIILAICTVISTIISLVSLIVAGCRKVIDYAKDKDYNKAKTEVEKMINDGAEKIEEIKDEVAGIKAEIKNTKEGN